HGGGPTARLVQRQVAGEVPVGDVLEGGEAGEVLHAGARGAHTGEGGGRFVRQIGDRHLVERHLHGDVAQTGGARHPQHGGSDLRGRRAVGEQALSDPHGEGEHGMEPAGVGGHSATVPRGYAGGRRLRAGG